MGEMEWALVVSGRRTNGGRGRTYAAASRGLGRHLDPDRREVVSAKLREAVEGEPLEEHARAGGLCWRWPSSRRARDATTRSRLGLFRALPSRSRHRLGRRPSRYRGQLEQGGLCSGCGGGWVPVPCEVLDLAEFGACVVENNREHEKQILRFEWRKCRAQFFFKIALR
jgi:hypothetical protein